MLSNVDPSILLDFPRHVDNGLREPDIIEPN